MQEETNEYGLRHKIGLFLGILIFVGMLLTPPPSNLNAHAWHTAALATLMAIWWLTEALPIAVTALLPIILLPLLNISPIKDATSPYANPVIFLFMGGFFIALSVQYHQLHRRIALLILSFVAPKPKAIIGGFMVATAFISMWVSNAATTLMLLPIGQSVVDLVLSDEIDDKQRANFSIAMMLSIAYAASIGGIGTLVGTPPNALLAGFMSETYGIKIGFAQWAMMGIPAVIISIPPAWYLLTYIVFPLTNQPLYKSKDLIQTQLQHLGHMSKGETATCGVFLITAILWMFEPLISTSIPNLSLSDAGIAITGSLLLFVIPLDLKKGEFILSWREAKKLPFDVLILFGGGISLAQAIQKSGLAKWLGNALQGLEAFGLVSGILLIAVIAIFVTELMSNTALAATFLPIVSPVAIGMGENPFFLLIPMVLGVSCAFMLPVGTPPNAIVYASGYVTAPQMARAGFWMNILFIVLITFFTLIALPLVFGVEYGILPDWAKGK